MIQVGGNATVRYDGDETIGPRDGKVAKRWLEDADSGIPVSLAAGYSKTTNGSDPPGRAPFSEAGSVMESRRYFPGPQAGSTSGKYIETASHTSGVKRREDNELIAKVFACVLSYTYCSGNPEELCDGVTEGVWDRV